jgi:hypothetical protein
MVGVALAALLLTGCSSSDGQATQAALDSSTSSGAVDPGTDAGDSSTSPVSGSGPLPFGFNRCDELIASGVVDGPLSDDPDIAAAQQWRADNGLPSDEAWVREVPTIANELPEASAFDAPLTDEEALSLFGRIDNVDFASLAAYGAQHEETFGGYWLDNTFNAPTMSFTEDVDERREEVAQLLPGVRVVEANMTEPGLHALQAELTSQVTERGLGNSSGVRTQLGGGVVSLYMHVLDEATMASVAEFADPGLVCLEGQEAEQYTPPGPQAESGENWRLLALEKVEVEFEAIFDQQTLARTWTSFGSEEDIPTVDFESDVVVTIPTNGMGIVNGPCGTRFDGWQLANGVVQLDLPTPGGATDCDAAWRPGAYLIAIAAAEIPAGPVTIEVSGRHRSEPMHSATFER